MSENKYLNEEQYKKTEKKLSIIALLILIAGLTVGGYLIYKGVGKKDSSQIDNEKIANIESNLKSKISEFESKKTEKLASEKQKLENKKAELLEKGIKYKSSATYDSGEEYDLKIVTNSLDPSFSYCKFDEYKDNSLTKDYCLFKENNDEYSKNIVAINNVLNFSSSCNWAEYKNLSVIQDYCSVKNINNDTTDRMTKIRYLPIGIFVCFTSFIISFFIFSIAKRRSILAFTTQQVMPVAQEGIEKMAPTIGKAGATIAKETAPIYGDIAREISKGIKEGTKGKDK